MAKCDLSIQLDHPDAVYAGGGTITGTVSVRADANVKCKGLEVSCGWRTHGRGNVASGTEQTVTLFTGEWMAGQQEEYRFELDIADWPPSYHGGYLNVDHYVDARAKIPWAFDPKASTEFLMRPTCGPDGASVTSTELGGTAGALIGGIVIVIFVLVFGGCFVGFIGAGFKNPIFFLIGFLAIGSIGAFIGLKFYLPRYLLGEVKCDLKSTQVSPGQQLDGELVLCPKRNVNLNAITMTFIGQEVCVSGSGSNQTTHTNTFYEKESILEPEGVLPAGTERHFPLAVPLPPDLPYSLDLSDNDIRWTVTVRIDIPKWPDWKQTFTINIVPTAEGAAPAEVIPAAAENLQADAPGTVEPSGKNELTFAETANHLWASKNDSEQMEMLVEAVTGLTFDLEARVERRLLYSGDDDPHVYEDGYAVWATYSDPPLPMVLYVPHHLADEFEQIGRDLWRGRGTVVGWDSQHRRLQVKLIV